MQILNKFSQCTWRQSEILPHSNSFFCGYSSRRLFSIFLYYSRRISQRTFSRRQHVQYTSLFNLPSWRTLESRLIQKTCLILSELIFASLPSEETNAMLYFCLFQAALPASGIGKCIPYLFSLSKSIDLFKKNKYLEQFFWYSYIFRENSIERTFVANSAPQTRRIDLLMKSKKRFSYAEFHPLVFFSIWKLKGT